MMRQPSVCPRSITTHLCSLILFLLMMITKPKWWHRPLKIENRGRSTAKAVDFRGLKPPHTVVNQGGSWLGFIEGSESFKMVVVVSKNFNGVGLNRHRNIGGHGGENG
ncbi:hypothetical protein DVH24_006941 [Malus domestica]|uniref:Uncharacterized protein n=1 Tax=Malus domestica TaxID=3750 RepID=A0A498IBB7_MALDO|nr:hypothetical protein DVH24_006941 [Malus domestica]